GVPNASVLVRDGATTVATLTVDATGNLSGTVALTYGQHVLSAVQQIGTEVSDATSTVHVEIVPGPPTIGAPPDAGAVLADSPVVVSGTAVPGATIAIAEPMPDGSLRAIATAIAAPDGTWSI